MLIFYKDVILYNKEVTLLNLVLLQVGPRAAGYEHHLENVPNLNEQSFQPCFSGNIIWWRFFIFILFYFSAAKIFAILYVLKLSLGVRQANKIWNIYFINL